MKQSGPSVSIIIVTFNNAGCIEATLHALPWHRQDVEVLVIDNHSTDGTAQTIQHFEALNSSPHQIILNRQNTGYARGVNQGLQLAGGRHIMLLGPDVTLQPDTLDMLQTSLDAVSRRGMTAPRLLSPAGKIQKSCRRLPSMTDLRLELSGLVRFFPHRWQAPWKMDDFDHAHSRDVEQPEASCILVKSKAVTEVGLMDTQFPLFFNDVDWCHRFSLKGWSIHFVHEASAHHIGGASVNQRRVSSIIRSHKAFFRYFSKYQLFPRGQRYLWGFLLMATALLRAILVLAIPRLKDRL